MKRVYWWSALLAVLVWTFVAKPVQAHHSFLAEFDGNRSLTIEGEIVRVDWVNPHGWWHVKSTAPNGDVILWDVQNESPSAMRQAGITRDKAGKPGDRVKILAYGAKDGTKNLAIVRTITFETGTMAGKSFRLFDLLDRQAQGSSPK